MAVRIQPLADSELQDALDVAGAIPSRRVESAELTMALPPGANRGHYCLVALEVPTDRLLAWVSAVPLAAADPSRLRINLLVDPRVQRRGIGSELLRELEGIVREDGAVVLEAVARPDEDAAIAFLHAAGFAPDSGGEQLLFSRRIA